MPLSSWRESSIWNSVEKSSSLPARRLSSPLNLLKAITAGIATKRPMAVANSASAMPGATTASEVFYDPAIAANEFMMPHTVPNSPTNGAAEPTEARNVM